MCDRCRPSQNVAYRGGHRQDEDELSSVKVRATRRQVEQLCAGLNRFEKRTWAIESAGGMGYLLAQQLVARGEVVLDVPATLAARIRVLATERSNKNDPNDAHSIAIAALRSPRLRAVEAADHSEVLRLLAKRNIDIGNQRTRVVCRLHALLAELTPGGIAKEIYVSDADALLAKLAPETPAQQIRFDLALELLDDVRRLDAQTEGVSPAHTSGRQGLGHLADRPLWGGPDSSRPRSSATRATSVVSPTAMPTPPTTGRLRSNSPRVAASCTGCHCGATAS